MLHCQYFNASNGEFNFLLFFIDEFKGHSLLEGCRQADLARVKKYLEVVNFKHPYTGETALVCLFLFVITSLQRYFPQNQLKLSFIFISLWVSLSSFLAVIVILLSVVDFEFENFHLENIQVQTIVGCTCTIIH